MVVGDGGDSDRYSPDVRHPLQHLQSILGKYSTADLNPSPLFAFICEIGSYEVI